MKFTTPELIAWLRGPSAREHIAVLRRFMASLLLMIIACTVIFHLIMLHEGQQHSWLTGLYWTLTVMSTLGFGDITFTSDLGRAFSILVLLSGVILFLIMLPFTFIQHFYVPWLDEQKKEMVPHRLKGDIEGHILIAGTDPIALNLADTLAKYKIRSVILCNDTQLALKLIGQGYEVVTGDHDDKRTYANLHVEKAALLMVMESDVRSTNIVFSAREAAPGLTIFAGIEKIEARDILRMAGCSRCFHFYSLIGEALARRVIKPTQRVSELGRFGNVIVAEAPVMRTPLVGKTLLQSKLRDLTGVNIVGLWERGVFRLPRLDTVFSQSTVLIAAGSQPQIDAFNHLLSSSDEEADDRPPTIILGGGRVGTAVARSLSRRGIKALIVDKVKLQSVNDTPVIQGDASDLAVLEKAGIRQAPTVIVTTHNDDTNIYLTIYCRRLRPDIQIISRASVDRNVNGLHMAGADLVLSLATLVSSTVINLLSPDRVLMINERLSVFRSTVGESLAGKTLMHSGIRNETGCSLLAVHGKDGIVHANPQATYQFSHGELLYLIGDSAGQTAFRERHGIDADFSREGSGDIAWD